MARGAKFADYVLTIPAGGVAQLSSVFPAVTGGLKEGAHDWAIQSLTLQPDGGNSNPMYFGAGSGVSASAYAFRLEKATSTIPPAPFVWELSGSLKLSDLWVFGTAGEKLTIGMVGL
jgi:hypothetical protein